MLGNKMVENSPTITIVGGGLAGTLMTIFLAREGFAVDLYEKRPDPRLERTEPGKSINLALSARGIDALQRIGLKEEVLKLAIPMRGRMIHDREGKLRFQPYGVSDSEVLHSVSRAGLNALLLDASEKVPNVRLHFNHKCKAIDWKQSRILFSTRETQPNEHDVPFELLIGADGALSQVRYQMQRLPRFQLAQDYLEHSYKELTIPPTPEGDFALEPNALHIWPRDDFMLIALPNADRSFTCTLFCPHEGERSFATLNNRQAVEKFFLETYPDAYRLMSRLIDDFFANPTGDLITVRCAPWHYRDRIVLIGDAAHAVVPFYGQGMNAAFEDCTVLIDCLKRNAPHFEFALREYEMLRKPHTDTLADLSLENYIEMRRKTASPVFLTLRLIENALHKIFPRWVMSLHGIVSFTCVPYRQCVERIRLQNRVFGALCLSLVVALLCASIF